MTPEILAERFHTLYEQLAPSFGYDTRKESAKPWADVPSQNKALMTEVCRHILTDHNDLTKEDLTDLFYTVKRQRDCLLGIIQKIRPFIYSAQRGEDPAISIEAINSLCNDAIKIIHPGESSEGTVAAWFDPDKR